MRPHIARRTINALFAALVLGVMALPLAHILTMAAYVYGDAQP